MAGHDTATKSKPNVAEDESGFLLDQAKLQIRIFCHDDVLTQRDYRWKQFVSYHRCMLFSTQTVQLCAILQSLILEQPVYDKFRGFLIL